MNVGDTQTLSATSSAGGTITYSVVGSTPTGVSFNTSANVLFFNNSDNFDNDTEIKIQASSSFGAISVINITLLKHYVNFGTLDFSYWKGVTSTTAESVLSSTDSIWNDVDNTIVLGTNTGFDLNFESNNIVFPDYIVRPSDGKAYKIVDFLDSGGAQSIFPSCKLSGKITLPHYITS
jgi:hypothetical protein